MEMQILTVIKLFGYPYTVCLIRNDHLLFFHESIKELKIYLSNVSKVQRLSEHQISAVTYLKCCIRTSALFLLPFLQECVNSKVFRSNLIKNLCSARKVNNVCLKLILKPPDKEIIDYAWNERMLRLVWTRVEIENAFSWLSTLGGAYSALGDYFVNCAEEAGRISQRQYKLSKLLGDDGLAARSKLYSALSFSQKGKLKLARHIVRNVADFARQTRDKRLLRMCQGVWAKLKYLKAIKNGKIIPTMTDNGDYVKENGRCS